MSRRSVLMLLAAAAAVLSTAAVVLLFAPQSRPSGDWVDAHAALSSVPVRHIDAPDADPAAVSKWRSRIQECMPLTDSEEYYTSEEIKSCLKGVFSSAAASSQTQALATALSGLIVEHPLLGIPCHAPAHEIGDVMLQAAGGDIVKALASHDHPSCEAGFIHGMIDAFAATDPSPLEFARLVDACEAQADTLMLHYCTHGTGHAAWALTLDGVAASRYCALLRTPEGRAQCGEGVMMNMYVPATGRFASRDQSLASAELPDVCSRWASPDLPGMLEGCAHGAAFVFSKHALEVVYRWADKVPYDSKEPLPDEFVLQASEAAGQVAAWCRELPGSAAESCLRDLGIAFPHVPHPLMLDKRVRTILCEPLGEKTLRRCVNEVRNNV